MERRGGSGYLYKKGPAQSRSQSPAPGSGCMELSELLGVGIKGIATGSSDTSLPGLNLAIGDNGAEGVTEGKGLTGRKSDSKSDITMKEKEKVFGWLGFSIRLYGNSPRWPNNVAKPNALKRGVCMWVI